MIRAPGLDGHPEGVDHPPVVAADVDRHDRGDRRGQRQRAHDIDGVAFEERHAGSELAEIDDELGGDAAGRRAGQHEHRMALVGETLDHQPCRRRVDVIERGRDVRSLDLRMEAHVVDAGPVTLLPDPLGRRPEVTTQVALHRGLQADVPLVAQLVGEAHDGGRPGFGGVGEVGDGSETDDLRPGEHDGRDPALGRGQPVAPFADPVGDGHRSCNVVQRLKMFHPCDIVERIFHVGWTRTSAGRVSQDECREGASRVTTLDRPAADDRRRHGVERRDRSGAGRAR